MVLWERAMGTWVTSVKNGSPLPRNEFSHARIGSVDFFSANTMFLILDYKYDTVLKIFEMESKIIYLIKFKIIK